MSEAFLHFIWKFRLFNHNDLFTTDGQSLEIVHPGTVNSDAGPDFFNAKIRIGSTLWAGNVEIHIHASDWYKHMHHQDKAYSNAILHVVYVDDIQLSSPPIIPVLVLDKRINSFTLSRYQQMNEATHWIPCAALIRQTPEILIKQWCTRVFIEKLEEKSNWITTCLTLNKQNWEESFYISIARSFGFHINALPFELLAKSLPLQILEKHRNNLFQLESLLFGQAGLLEETFSDGYPRKLQNEYEFLKNKFKLMPLPTHIWKFLRLRPANFPTLRIAQFASLIHSNHPLFARCMDCRQIAELEDIFKVSINDYWTNHYLFDRPSQPINKIIGIHSIHQLLINTVIPFLFVYGREKANEQLIQKGIAFMEQIAAENNTIIKQWNKLGITPINALESQAMIYLKNNYCDSKKCLQCSIGTNILKKENRL